MSDPTVPAVAAPPGWMTFEFPCNERIRSLLRIESLFKRCQEFNQYTTAFGHQAAL
ncbi:MAG: cell division protein ZapD, partial [Betaproteobacteria bacterium]|nr:cell division protein ZapD [Betaproteobacteria bacterium]